MNRKYTYYSGIFNAQFSVGAKESKRASKEFASGSRSVFRDLNLEEIKEFKNPDELAKEAFEEVSSSPEAGSFIYRTTQEGWIEFHAEESLEPTKRRYDLLILHFKEDASDLRSSQGDFYTQKEGGHGKLSARAFIRFCEYELSVSTRATEKDFLYFKGKVTTDFWISDRPVIGSTELPGQWGNIQLAQEKVLDDAVQISEEEYDRLVLASEQRRAQPAGESPLEIEVNASGPVTIRTGEGRWLGALSYDRLNMSVSPQLPQMEGGSAAPASGAGRGTLSAQGVMRCRKRPTKTIPTKEPCFKGRAGRMLFGGPKSRGCFGSNGRMFNTPMSGPGTGGCCFGPSPQGGGCFGGTSGCFGVSGGNGCFGWIWQLLKWLLALGLLLYLLSMLRQCASPPQDQVIYLHDTVIKYKYDTVRVLEYDTVSVKERTVVKTKTTDKISLPNVQFKTNSDELLETSLPDIQKLADFLIRNDTVTATIEGHTDDVGDDSLNMDLSQRRADAVRRVLIDMGVDSLRIGAKGYGETRFKAYGPGNPDKSPEGRLMNRRVEVKLENLGESSSSKTETSRE